jgi:hypothetical protein
LNLFPVAQLTYIDRHFSFVNWKGRHECSDDLEVSQRVFYRHWLWRNGANTPRLSHPYGAMIFVAAIPVGFQIENQKQGGKLSGTDQFF